MLTSCIGDDILDDFSKPEIRISNPIDSLALDSNYTFEAQYFDNVGKPNTGSYTWTSGDPSVVSINNGLALALDSGCAYIKVQFNDGEYEVADSVKVNVGVTTSIGIQQKIGSVYTTSSYALQGNYTLTEENGVLTLGLDNTYNASTALPGLYVYLSNNTTSIANAYEIGAVTTFKGTHEYIINNIGINDYSYILYFCKPFNVKVGEGIIQ